MSDSATLSIFHHLFASVAEEMGVTLGRAAYSPNIKERLDFSCAVFLGDGRMLAQAAHIPVHLGAMPASVQAAIKRCAPFTPGDVVILNDPYLGGTHLPDVTLVSPIFISQDSPNPQFFVASRAHHADIGGMSPGSMPLSTEIYQEGMIIPPIKIIVGGQRNTAVWDLFMRNVRTPAEREGDLTAQLAAHTTGQKRLSEIVERYGLVQTIDQAENLITYADRMTRAAIRQIPDGLYQFEDFLDNDGQTEEPVPIKLSLTIFEDEVTADFSGSAPAVSGNLNAVPAIVESAVSYCLRCLAQALLDTELPMNHGAFSPLTVLTEPGSLLNPYPPHAVAAGNVETSQRVVDVVFGALAQALPHLVPAASQGTMNNLTFGGTVKGNQSGEPDQPFAYYETIGGGAGAGRVGQGASGIHVHMSNTRNTPVEAMEYTFPLRLVEYALRNGSGGQGEHLGGDGLVRTIEFLSSVSVTLVSERRTTAPYGLNGAKPGENGRNTLIRNGRLIPLPGKTTQQLQPGDQIRIETPGGGGWNNPKSDT